MCYTIDEIKEKTIPIALTYGIQSLSLFGSYARNEADDNSDVDICIEKGSLRSLLQYSSNMCIIQIGELVSRLSDEFLEQHKYIPWHAIKSMRNLHAHERVLRIIEVFRLLGTLFFVAKK